MGLNALQERMIGKYMDTEWYKVYGWRLGSGEFSRLCNTRRDYDMQSLARALQTDLGLLFPGEESGLDKMMPTLLHDLTIEYDVNYGRRCGGCRGKMKVTAVDGASSAPFCVLAMINALRSGNISDDKMRDVLESTEPVGKQSQDYDEVEKCRHGFK